MLEENILLDNRHCISWQKIADALNDDYWDAAAVKSVRHYLKSRIDSMVDRRRSKYTHGNVYYSYQHLQIYNSLTNDSL